MRRFKGNMQGEPYLADINTQKVHELDNEESQCNIDKIIYSGHDLPYSYFLDAQYDGYKECKFCCYGSE